VEIVQFAATLAVADKLLVSVPALTLKLHTANKEAITVLENVKLDFFEEVLSMILTPKFKLNVMFPVKYFSLF
jgi:hypothetical protein